MTWEKIDERRFKEVVLQDKEYDILVLLENKKGLEARIIEIQGKIAAVDALLAQAAKLGITETEVAPVEPTAPAE